VNTLKIKLTNSKDFNPVVDLDSVPVTNNFYAFTSDSNQRYSTQEIELGDLVKVSDNDIDSVLDN